MLAVQADRKVLVGYGTIGRINPDGSVDKTFNPPTESGVYCLAAQTDGRLLVAGEFKAMQGRPRTSLTRLNCDGSLDRDFHPVVSGAYLYGSGAPRILGLAVHADGRPCSGLARLNPDGTVDSAFRGSIALSGLLLLQAR
jgi:hypothetical protein